MDVSSEARYDFSRLRINGALVYNRSGTGRQSGQTFAPAGATISAEYYKDGSVNSRADRGYIISLYMASPVGNNVNLSGADFATYSFGLGKVQPTRAVAFQGRTPGSFSNSNDGFSFLANQRTNGRYGTIQGQYTNNVSSTTNRGEFTINFNNATRTFGGTSEIFYVFARDLNADKNTIFLPNHGISDATEATITMTESQFNNGERFKFSNSSGAAFEAEREFQAVMNVLSNDVFRIQRIANPISDDILDWPLSGFSIEYREENALYNTIFVNNHKITGSEESLYAAEGRDLPATVSYNVAVDSTDTAFVLNGIGLGVNELNPTLVVYRNQPYAFNVDAINNGLYLTTDNGVNFVADGYVDEYTVGVTNSRTQAGVLS